MLSNNSDSNPELLSPSHSAGEEREFYFGRWTRDEETYANELIREFQAGTLENVEEGATLRNFLAEKLTCHAKRISKKYEGSHYNGRQRFRRKEDVIPKEELEEKRRTIIKLQEAFAEARKRSQKAHSRKAKAPTKKQVQPKNTPSQDNRQSVAATENAALLSSQPNPAPGFSSLGPLPHDEYNRIMSSRMDPSQAISMAIADLTSQQRLASLQASLGSSSFTGGGSFYPGGLAGLNTTDNLAHAAGLGGLYGRADAQQPSQTNLDALLALTRAPTGLFTREDMLLHHILSGATPASGLGNLNGSLAIQRALALAGSSPPFPPHAFDGTNLASSEGFTAALEAENRRASLERFTRPAQQVAEEKESFQAALPVRGERKRSQDPEENPQAKRSRAPHAA